MSLSDLTNRISYLGDGSSASFSFPHYFFKQADLKVYLYDSLTGSSQLQVLNTNYSIGSGSNVVTANGVYPFGAPVVMASAIVSTTYIVITRAPQETQNFVLQQNGVIPSVALTQQFDYLTLLVQRLNDKSHFTVRLPDGFAGNFDPSLPAGMSSFTGQALCVNSSGTGWAYGPFYGPYIPNTLLYTPTASSIQSLGGGTAGLVLTSNGSSAPSWTYVSLSGSSVAGTLSLGNGGTGGINPETWGVVYASSATQLATTDPGPSGFPLISQQSSAPVFQKLNLALAGSGFLPVANGGTGGATYFSGSGALQIANNLSEVVAATAFKNISPLASTGDLIIYGSNSVQVALPAGTSGFVLTAKGANTQPVWQASPSGSGALLIANNLSEVVAATAFKNISPMTTTGDMIIYGSNAAQVRLQSGPTGYVLTASGSSAQPTWAAASAGGSGALLIANNLSEVVAATAFKNISPMTTWGDIIYSGSGNIATRLQSGPSGYVLQASGSSAAPAWAAISSSGSGVGARGFITNTDAETDTSGWATYADAAASTPVDGTGGAPTVTWTRSTSTPLTGTASFLFTKDAANRQGEGASYDFTISNADQAKVLKIDFDYIVGSGTFVAGASGVDSDIEVYIYDVTNAVLIQPSTYKLYANSSTVSSHFSAAFQTASNSTSYRLIFHTATTSASAFTVKFDSVNVTTSSYVYGTPITDWTAFTPTGAWSTNTTYTGFWRRVGGDLEYRIHLALAGAPTSASLFINYLPTGLSADTARLPATSNFLNLGAGIAKSAGNAYDLVAAYDTSTAIWIFAKNASSTYLGASNAFTQALPNTFASGDSIDVYGSVPVSGWGSSVQMSTDADSRVAAVVLQGSSTSLTSSEVTITPTTVTKDTHGAFLTTTYTIPVSGIWRVSAFVEAGSVSQSAGNSVYVGFKKNSAATVIIGLDRVATTDTAAYAASGSLDYPFNAGDTVVFRASSTATVNAADFNASITLVSGTTSIGATETIAARYYDSTSTPGTSGSTNQITFSTKDYDTHGAYSSGTYTIPAAGYYEVNTSTYATATTTAANEAITLVIKKSGTVVGQVKSYFASATSKPVSTPASALIKCVAGDTITIGAGNDGTTPATTSNTSLNYFEIHRVGL